MTSPALGNTVLHRLIPAASARTGYISSCG